MVAMCPAVFYMLEKFGVPRAVRLTAVPPKQDEFRNLLTGKFGVNPRHMQDIKNRIAGLPVCGNGRDFLIVVYRSGIAGPLQSNMLNKT